MNCFYHAEAPNVAFCIHCGRALCNECIRNVKGSVYCEPCLGEYVEGKASASSSSGSSIPNGASVKKEIGGTNPGAAFALGLIPGVGAIYNGEFVKAEKQFDDRSPIDTSILLGHFQQGTREHVRAAVAAARAAYPAWAALSWQRRLVHVRKIADAIREHRSELSALMGYEVGKNRLECVGDVEEAADLMAYYCDQIEAHNGFVEKMGTLGPGEDNVSVLRPLAIALTRIRSPIGRTP